MNTKVILVFLISMLFDFSYGQSLDENSVIINQYFQNAGENLIGLNNSSANSSQTSYVNLVQTGFNNNIHLNSVNRDNQTVQQFGNNNSYENYVYYNTEKTNKTINQEGNLNSLLIFGENSLMKNLIINQKADFQSIVIKNYTN
ncbi:hypothetical protein [Namhaeicola litoreus]|uniref:Curlin associated repeat-containing protein n=1 Tax=Namhaeicola litoreus TaxID=1052145 RepID=A0ABW3XXB3_9FLAO